MGNKKGQSEIIYLVITVGIAFLIAAGIFMFSKIYSNNMNEKLAEAGLERTSIQVENGLLELKYLVDTTNETNMSIRLKIPEKIGEQEYVISGLGNNTIEYKTLSESAALRLKTTNFWNVALYGSVMSSQGSIELQLINATSVILK